MKGLILQYVAPETVPARHYFLEWLNTPQVIWTIRLLAVIGGVTALIIYYKMRGKRS